MKKILVFVLIISFLGNFLFSEDIFLETCLSIGIMRNKMLVTKSKEIELAERQLLSSTRSFFPNMMVEYRNSKGKAERERGPREEYQAKDMWIKVLQPLYDGGRISASYKYSSYALEVAKIEYTKAKEDLIYKIKSAYYEYISSLFEVEEIGRMVKEIDRYYEKLEKEYQAKAVSELDMEEGKVFKLKVESMYEKAIRNKIFAENRLILLVGIKDLDEIFYPLPMNFLETPPQEINFDLQQLKEFILVNSVELKKIKLNMLMAKEKEKMVKGKILPKFYLEGTYGQSGEAYVTEPLQLATVWNGTIKMAWLFGGSSSEGIYLQEKAIPRDIMDSSQRTDSNTLNFKFGLFDDTKYFVEKKEAEVGKSATEAEYEENFRNLTIELEKLYNEYYSSLLDAKALNYDLKLKKWRLNVAMKRNELYEVATIEVMDSIFKVSETVLSYVKAVIQNYTSVSGLERITLMRLR